MSEQEKRTDASTAPEESAESDPTPRSTGGQEGRTDTGTIPDEALPDELIPSEDNPLAEGLPPGETVESIREEEGRDAEDAEGPQGEHA